MGAKDTLLRGTKNAYVKTVGTVARATTGSSLPPSRDQRFKHWLASLPRVHDSLAIAELDVPWWTYHSIDVVEAWLEARRGPTSVFEYGSGASTLWLAGRTTKVDSVEHHAGFASMMRSAIDAPHVSLRTVEPVASSSPRIRSGKEGHEGLDFYDYVHAIDDADGPYDVVVIDGRAREACLLAAVDHLAEDGLIIFDNSARRRYRPTIERVAGRERRLRGLTPTLPYPEQTSLITL